MPGEVPAGGKEGKGIDLGISGARAKTSAEAEIVWEDKTPGGTGQLPEASGVTGEVGRVEVPFVVGAEETAPSGKWLLIVTAEALVGVL